jgi:hypothetical protein
MSFPGPLTVEQRLPIVRGLIVECEVSDSEMADWTRTLVGRKAKGNDGVTHNNTRTSSMKIRFHVTRVVLRLRRAPGTRPMSMWKGSRA